jgi:hypothetical protein
MRLARVVIPRSLCFQKKKKKDNLSKVTIFNTTPTPSNTHIISSFAYLFLFQCILLSYYLRFRIYIILVSKINLLYRN